MGCLKFIAKILIIVLAIVGAKYLIDKKSLKDLNFFKKPSQEAMKEKASKIADFTQVPDEYIIERVNSVFNHNLVIAEHKASGQKMILLEPNKTEIITKKDFETREIDKKIDDLTEKMENHFIHLENVKIIKRSSMHSMKQNIPYVKIEADMVNMPFSHIQGIIGVADTAKDKNVIVIAVNKEDKYSQIITEHFFNKVRPAMPASRR